MSKFEQYGTITISPTLITDEERTYGLHRQSGEGTGSTGVTSWNDLTDKPFYEETGEGEIVLLEHAVFTDGSATIVSDRFTIDKELFLKIETGPVTPLAYRGVFNRGNESVHIYGNASLYPEFNGEEDTGEDLAFATGTFMGSIYDGQTFYLDSARSREGSSFYNVSRQIKIYYVGTVSTVHTLDPKFIPKAGPVSPAAGDTPTKGEFDTLIAALKIAGLMEWK